jgi:hypothetical protein
MPCGVRSGVLRGVIVVYAVLYPFWGKGALYPLYLQLRGIVVGVAARGNNRQTMAKQRGYSGVQRGVGVGLWGICAPVRYCWGSCGVYLALYLTCGYRCNNYQSKVCKVLRYYFVIAAALR